MEAYAKECLRWEEANSTGEEPEAGPVKGDGGTEGYLIFKDCSKLMAGDFTAACNQLPPYQLSVS